MSAESLIEEIVEDRESGASQLTIKAASLFLKLLEKKPSMREVSRFARLLADARPSMPSIANLAYMVLGDVEKLTSTGMTLEEAVESAVRSAVKDYQRRLRDTIREAVKLLSGYRCILTHSYSSTIAAAIELCEDLKIIVTESRPRFEGVKLAERLASSGFDVTLIVDSAASYVLERGEVDAVVVGCDAILDDCSIVNKIGTRMIALAARETRTPFHVVTDLWKAAVHGFSFEEHSSREVYGKEIEGINVRNPYFERVPPKLVSKFITDEGVLTPRMLKEKLLELWGNLSPKSYRGLLSKNLSSDLFRL